MVSGDDSGRLISCWRGGEEHVPEGTSRTMFLFFRYNESRENCPLFYGKSRACGPPYPSKYLAFHETNRYLSIPNYTANGSFRFEFSREREREEKSLFHPFVRASTPAARINPYRKLFLIVDSFLSLKERIFANYTVSRSKVRNET